MAAIAIFGSKAIARKSITAKEKCNESIERLLSEFPYPTKDLTKLGAQ
jgi:hypothetical protein